MENNNDNNLFTSMFGIESEEPKEPVIEQPVQEQTPIVEPQPQVVQQPQVLQPTQPIQEEIITLDSNKPIEESQPVVEQPTLNTINMNPNYEPVQPIYASDDDLDLTKLSSSNYKTICIILGVTVLVLLLAFPLYTGLNNYLSKNKTPKEETPQVQTPTETPNQQPEEPEEPVLPPIEFDLNLSFEKGYSTNPKEYQQKVPYVPSTNEGVVKCETIKTMSTTDGQSEAAVYFYYKDKMVKKILTVDYIKLNNYQLYNQYVRSYQSFVTTVQANEHLFTKLEVDKNTYRMNFYTLADLAYNQATKIPDSKFYFDIKMSYNTPIKNAMSKFLTTKEYINNMYCSTLITSDASI